MPGEKNPNTADVILDEACSLLAEVGPDAFSTREVARRANVSIGTLQYHYKSRAELVDACIDTVATRLADLRRDFQTHLLDKVAPAEAIGKATRVAFRYACNRQPFIRLLVSTIVSSGGVDSRRHDEIERPFLEELAAWLAPVTGLPAAELQLRVKAMIILVGRYAITNDETLCSLSGREDIDEAVAVIEGHLESMAIDLLTRPRGDGDV